MRLLLVLSGISLVASAFGQTTVSPSTATVNAASGTGTFTLTQTTAAAWTAASSAAWLTVSPPTGSGSQAFTYNFTANPNPEARMATITVADRAFALLQRGTTGLYTPWSTMTPGQIVSLDGFSGYSSLNAPRSVAVDGNGDVYIGNTGNYRVQRLDAVTGVITTEAGNGTEGDSLAGPATGVEFTFITGVAADSSGSPFFVADAGTGFITRVDRVSGLAAVLASTALAPFASVVVDNAGNAYFTTQSTSAPFTPNAIWRLDGVTFNLSTVATFDTGGPYEAALDALGNFYVADGGSGQILRIDALTRNVTTVIAVNQPSGPAVDGRGNLYIASAANNSVQRMDALTSAVTAVGSGLSGPAGVATDALGNLYIANTGANQVLFVDMVTPQGTVFGNVPQTIVFSLPGTTNYNSPPFSVSAVASSGLPVSFVSNTPAVCTVNGATVSLVALGTCSITASQAGNATYAAASVTQTTNVILAAQTITFGALSNLTLGAMPFAVSATASSGLAVSFSSTTPSVCTVSGTTVTLASAGTCSIVASQTGNAFYAAATPISQSFMVSNGLATPLAAAFLDQYGAPALTFYGSTDFPDAGGYLIGVPGVAQEPNGGAFVVGLDSAGGVHLNSYSTEYSTWNGWQYSGGILDTSSGLTAEVDPSGIVWFTGRDIGNRYWINSWNGTTFGGWILLDQGIFSPDSIPQIAITPDGNIWVIGKDIGGRVWSNSYNPVNQAFSGWVDRQGIITGQPSVTTGQDGFVYVAVRSVASNSPVYITQIPAGNAPTATSWLNGGGQIDTDPQITSQGGTVYLMALAVGGTVYTLTFAEANQTYGAWNFTNGSLMDATIAGQGGNAFIAGRDTSGRIYWYSVTGNSWILAGGAGISSTVLAGAK